ncbi:flagellar export protein FliJ [Lentibacillus sp.]|uniref:flagellar export protein FliJ n=1 Tax=Lentibacillus sp. TaxID=1925746 RepID=UPI002B4B13F8|nr:flagellar export protein FliJ [Lentibacillus sp.]HLS07991.1 flagellar export protein FliJ [Lentibacillus sp.]
MAETAALSKILHVRENEKNVAEKSYQKSIDLFEEVATRLYNLLRKKETAESSYEDYLQQTTSIDKIREQSAYIEKLNKQIVELQSEMQRARNDMEAKHERLNHAYVEVKKFEKIIEHRHKENAAIIRKHEQALMDEISVQQYLSQKTGESYGSD